jgi:hypothetical protein
MGKPQKSFIWQQKKPMLRLKTEVKRVSKLNVDDRMGRLQTTDDTSQLRILALRLKDGMKLFHGGQCVQTTQGIQTQT